MAASLYVTRIFKGATPKRRTSVQASRCISLTFFKANTPCFRLYFSRDVVYHLQIQGDYTFRGRKSHMDIVVYHLHLQGDYTRPACLGFLSSLYITYIYKVTTPSSSGLLIFSCCISPTFTRWLHHISSNSLNHIMLGDFMSGKNPSR